MPASNPLHSLSVRAARVICVWAGLLLLLLQSFGPVLASSGESVWVEICSEAGAVWVEVDLEEETKDPTAPCPKCAECTLCAVTTAAPVPGLPQIALSGSVRAFDQRAELSSAKRQSDWLWPETRGPPCATRETTERAQRASMASTLNFGGAPWS